MRVQRRAKRCPHIKGRQPAALFSLREDESMKIYLPGGKGKHTIYSQPGREFPTSDFCEADGRPKMFATVFVEGIADVTAELGRYLVDQGVASRSPLIVPQGIAA